MRAASFNSLGPNSARNYFEGYFDFRNAERNCARKFNENHLMSVNNNNNDNNNNSNIFNNKINRVNNFTEQSNYICCAFFLSMLQLPLYFFEMFSSDCRDS